MRGLRLASSALPALAVVAVTGCALFRVPTFERPTLELERIEVTGLGLSGGTLNLVLDVYNPNGYELRTMGLQATLALEDTHFGEAALYDDIVLSSEAHTSVEIPVTFSWEGVGAGARAFLERGSIAYTFDGRLRVSALGRERALDLERKGTVPLRDLVGR